MHRLLRTEAYNIAQRQSGSRLIQDMLEDDIRILHGSYKIALKSRLLRNSPLPHELMYTDCDYRLLSLGIVDIDVHDDLQIDYLKHALLIEEEMLSLMNIKVGILGHNRSDYDIMLMPYEEEKEPIEIEKIEKRKVVSMVELAKQIPRIEISMKDLEISTKKYDKIREVARKKWILREIKRRERRMTIDTYSIVTTID